MASGVYKVCQHGKVTGQITENRQNRPEEPYVLLTGFAGSFILPGLQDVYKRQDTFKEEKTRKKNLTSLFPDVARESFTGPEESTEVHTSYEEIKYRLEIKRIVMDDKTPLEEILGTGNDVALYAVYLFDETEILQFKQEIDDQKMVAGLIYLDNYDEALESVEEVSTSERWFPPFDCIAGRWH